MEITSATTSGILAGIHQIFNQCCEMTELIKKNIQLVDRLGETHVQSRKSSKLRQVNLISSSSGLITIY